MAWSWMLVPGFGTGLYGPCCKLGLYTAHRFEDPILVHYKNHTRVMMNDRLQ